MSAELKPCPFCGMKLAHMGGDHYVHMASICILSHLDVFASTMARGWNAREPITRAPAEPSPAEMMVGQAYQVIGSLAADADFYEREEVQRALDYFSKGEYREDFLPWALESAPARPAPEALVEQITALLVEHTDEDGFTIDPSDIARMILAALTARKATDEGER